MAHRFSPCALLAVAVVGAIGAVGALGGASLPPARALLASAVDPSEPAADIELLEPLVPLLPLAPLEPRLIGARWSGPRRAASADFVVPGRIVLHDGLSGGEIAGTTSCAAWRPSAADPRVGTFLSATPHGLSLVGWTVQPVDDRLHVESPSNEIVLGFRTKSVLVVQPLRRVASVCVEILDHDGRPAVDPVVVAKMGGVEPASFEGQPRLGSACCALRLPYLPGEPVQVLCESHDGDAAATFDWVIAEGDHLAERNVLARLPPPDSNRSFTGRGGSSSRGGGSGGRRRETSLPSGTLHLLVLGRDGRPLPGLSVWLWGPTSKSVRTDAAGRVTASLEAGEYECSVVVPGVVGFNQRLDVAPRAAVSYTLREPQQAELHVRVVDHMGNALPYARLAVRPALGVWVDEEDGVQRIDPFTDVFGRRRIGGLPAGNARLEARWGSRRAHAVVECRAGEASALELMLPAPNRSSCGEP